MKIRGDFVTNSSSSSFVMIFDTKPESSFALLPFMNLEQANFIFDKIINGEHRGKLTKTKIKKILARVDSRLEYNVSVWCKKVDDELTGHFVGMKDFCEILEAANAEAGKDASGEKWHEVMDRIEAENNKMVAKYNVEFRKLLEERLNEKIGKFVSIIEVGDHFNIGAELEHKVLPHADLPMCIVLSNH